MHLHLSGSCSPMNIEYKVIGKGLLHALSE